MRQIATPLCYALVVGLFWLDRDRNRDVRVSKSLWLPFVYLLICGSRPVSVWLGIGPSSDGGSIYVEGSPVDRAIYIVLLVAAVAVLVRRRDRVAPLLRNNTAILLFFAFAAVSFLWSDFPLVTFKHWTKSVCDLSMALIIVTEIDPIAAIRRVLAWSGFILIPFSLLLCKYYPALGRRLSKGWALLYCGVTQDKNELGAICVVFGLASLWCFLEACRASGRLRWRRMLAHATVIGICGWLLGMCNSMTSVSSLVMIGVVLAIVGASTRGTKLSIVHLAVAGIVGFTLFTLFGPGGGLLQDVGRNPTLTGRTEVWHDVLQIPNNALVGTGYESFWLGKRLDEIRVLAGFDVNEAHDGYLEMYLNLGWTGVALLSLMIVVGYRKIIIAYRRYPIAGSLCLAMLLAALFHSLTEAGFRIQTPTWIVFLWAIIAATQINNAPDMPLPTGNASDDIEQPEPLTERALDGRYF